MWYGMGYMLKTYDPKVHHRRSIRLPAYDYGEPGLYLPAGRQVS